MQSADETYRDAVDLYWIAFLITACADRAVDIVTDELEQSSLLSPYSLPSSRRAVITSALKTMRDQLALSKIRLENRPIGQSKLPSRKWSLDPNTNKAQIREALLTIDVFPRCALLLTVFEHFEIDEAADLLNADPELVIEGRMVAFFEMTRNLASLQGWGGERANALTIDRESQYA